MSLLKQLPLIPDEEITPTISLLLEIIQQKSEKIQLLKDEIARLKGQKPKPEIKPSNLDKKTDKKNQTRKNLIKKRSPKPKIFTSMRISQFILKISLKKVPSLIIRTMLFRI